MEQHKFIKVKNSSFIDSISISQEDGLLVKFSSGSVYAYPLAKKSDFIGMRDSENSSEFYNKNVASQAFKKLA